MTRDSHPVLIVERHVVLAVPLLHAHEPLVGVSWYDTLAVAESLQSREIAGRAIGFEDVDDLRVVERAPEVAVEPQLVTQNPCRPTSPLTS